MQYHLIVENNGDKFVQYVNNMLKTGWKLHGGTFIAGNNYCQAFTKE